MECCINNALWEFATAYLYLYMWKCKKKNPGRSRATRVLANIFESINFRRRGRKFEERYSICQKNKDLQSCYCATNILQDCKAESNFCAVFQHFYKNIFTDKEFKHTEESQCTRIYLREYFCQLFFQKMPCLLLQVFLEFLGQKCSVYYFLDLVS